MKVKRSFFLYLAFAIEILILYVVQGTPNLIPEILGGKPLLLIPAALTITAKEQQIPSLVFGAVCGILTDIAANGGVGLFAILLTLICYFESHIFKTYFVSSFWSVMIISVIAIPLLICLYFLLLMLVSNVDNWQVLFVNHYISRMVYTLAAVVPLYFLNGFLYKKLR
ncbi:MAG: rod shape-determining protein MreD [Clostridiales bacterium]|nr:rod shape-determining protein MreD [Clostridiales bacterium]